MAVSLIFFSGAELSLPLLNVLLHDSRFEVKGVVAPPDKAVGRKLELQAPAPKALAMKHGVPVYQPEKLSAETALLQQFQSDPPDFLLTFAYGYLIPESWLSLPSVAPLNVHVSLLPKYRGASPVQAALLNGDSKSGYSLMKMVKAMDAGPVAFQEALAIPLDMTAGELHDALGLLAAEKVPNQLIELKEKPHFEEQNEAEATHCGKISREDGYLDFQESSTQIYRKYQAYTPWPGLWTQYEGKRLKILSLQTATHSLKPGCVALEDGRVYVGTQDGSVELLELQAEGKRAMSAKDFCLGQSGFASASLPS